MVIDIFKEILVVIYRLPIAILLILTVMLIFGGLLFWLHFFKGKNKSFASLLALLMSIFFILAVTVLSRDFGSVSELSLTPFASWADYFNGSNAEFLRTNIFNILLFMPFGASMYAVGYTKISLKTCLIITVAASLVLSVSVESAQFILQCGESETDDVIHNVLGAVLGMLLAGNVCDLYGSCIKRN